MVQDKYLFDGEARFTLQDRKMLDSLLARYAPHGCRRLQSEAKSAKYQLAKAEPSARDLYRQRYFETHTPCTPEDAEALRGLHAKAYQAKDIECENDTRWALDRAVEDGLLSPAAAQQKYDQYTRERLNEVRTLARDLMFALGEQSSLQTWGATASAKDREEVAGRWEEFSRFAKAKAEFQEQLAACKSIEEKAELRAAFPEFLEA